MRYFKLDRPMRADQVSVRLFGDVSYTQDIMRLNPDLICTMTIPAGTVLIVPEPKEPEPTGVHLW